MWNYFSVLIVVVLLAFDYVSCRVFYTNTCPRIVLRNGRIRTKQRGRFLKFSCNQGFILAGERYSICQTDGTWDLPPPKCVKPTCYTRTQPNPPANGLIFPSHGNGVLNFYCKSGYQLRGSPVMFCDGFKWDNHPPTCFPSNEKPKLFCDFEQEDICQWSHDWNHDFNWQRENYQTPSGAIGTGPSFDHTKGPENDGHYMYIESSARRVNDTARLISPVFDKMSTNTCLEFWYHMYGATTGTLRAYIKKVSQPLPLNPKNAIFSKSGNQGNKWYRSFHDLGPIDENFQVILEGIRGPGYVSDIAIDDVKVIENCVYEDHIIITSTDEPTTMTEIIKTVESCVDRCGYKALGNESKTVINCDCDDSCFENRRCCPDYWETCFVSTSTYTYETSSNLPNTIINKVINRNGTSEEKNKDTTKKMETTSVSVTRTTPTKTTTIKTTTAEKTTLKTMSTTKKSNTTPKIVVKPSKVPIIEPQKRTLLPQKEPKTPVVESKTTMIQPKKPVIQQTTIIIQPIKHDIIQSTTTVKQSSIKPTTKPTVSSKKPRTKDVVTQRPLIILTQGTTTEIVKKVLPNEVKNITTEESIETNDVADLPNDNNDEKSEDLSHNEDDNEVLNEKDDDFSHYDERDDFGKEFETDAYFDHELKESKKLTVQTQEEYSNTKTIFVIVTGACAVVILALFTVIMLVKYRIIKIYGRKLQTGNGTTSQSDVRFLTADEALDFSVDSVSYSSSTL